MNGGIPFWTIVIVALMSGFRLARHIVLALLLSSAGLVLIGYESLIAATERGIAVPTEPTAMIAVPAGGAADVVFEYTFRDFHATSPGPPPDDSTVGPNGGEGGDQPDVSTIPGRPSDFRFTVGNQAMPVRWNPCKPISWALTTDDGGE